MDGALDIFVSTIAKAEDSPQAEQGRRNQSPSKLCEGGPVKQGKDEQGQKNAGQDQCERKM